MFFNREGMREILNDFMLLFTGWDGEGDPPQRNVKDMTLFYVVVGVTVAIMAIVTALSITLQ